MVGPAPSASEAERGCSGVAAGRWDKHGGFQGGGRDDDFKGTEGHPCHLQARGGAASSGED